MRIENTPTTIYIMPPNAERALKTVYAVRVMVVSCSFNRNIRFIGALKITGEAADTIVSSNLLR